MIKEFFFELAILKIIKGKNCTYRNIIQELNKNSYFELMNESYIKTKINELIEDKILLKLRTSINLLEINPKLINQISILIKDYNNLLYILEKDKMADFLKLKLNDDSEYKEEII